MMKRPQRKRCAPKKNTPRESWRAAPILWLILLTGCVASDSNPLDTYAGFCPPLVAYSDQQQDLAAEELGQLPAKSGLAEMIHDYALLRAMVRDCQGK